MKTTSSNFIIMKELQDPEMKLVHGGNCNCYCSRMTVIAPTRARVPVSTSVKWVANPSECRNECATLGLTYSRCE